MKKRLKYALALFVGLAAALTALELGLRVFAAMGYRPRQTQASPPDSNGTILCAGDSFTYGLGASSRSKDYPGQLNDLFLRSGGHYAVLNAGVPGTNTALMLRRLPQALEQTHPSAVIIMSGSNNYWNLQGAWGLEDSEIKDKLRNVLFKSSTYKFYSYMTQDFGKPEAAPGPETQAPTLSRSEEEALAALTSRNLPKAEKLYSELIAKDKRNGSAWAGLSNVYFAQDKNKLAMMTALDGLKTASSGKYKLLYNVGKYYFLLWQTRATADSNYLSATHWFEKAAADALASGDMETARRTLWDLCSSYRSAGEQTRGVAFIASLPLPEKDRRIFTAYLKTRNLDGKIQLWLAHDLRTAAKLCRRHKAKLFLANFPDQAVYDAINRQIRALAAELGAPLIDNTAYFTLLRRANPKDFDRKYFVSDGHCNDAGYALMAENAYRVLVANGFK